MQLVCVGEVTHEYQIKVAENIKKQLLPGEKIRVKIESLNEEKEKNRLDTIERMKAMSRASKLRIYNKTISREDAHDRDLSPNK